MLKENNNTDSSYVEKLTTLSDIELIREQSENFLELMFFQIQLEAEKDDSKPAIDFASSVEKLEGKIRAVKKEIDRRDEVTTSRLSLLHRAIEESNVVVLSAEFLRVSLDKEIKNEKIYETLQQIVESAKESTRLITAFAQMNVAKSDWTEAKIAGLSK